MFGLSLISLGFSLCVRYYSHLLSGIFYDSLLICMCWYQSIGHARRAEGEKGVGRMFLVQGVGVLKEG